MQKCPHKKVLLWREPPLRNSNHRTQSRYARRSSYSTEYASNHCSSIQHITNVVNVAFDMRHSPEDNNDYKTTGLPDSPSTPHHDNFNKYDWFEYCDHTHSARPESDYKDPEHNWSSEHRDHIQRARPKSNWSIGCLWNRSSPPRNPNGISSVGGNEDKMQSCAPNRSSHSECETSGNNFNSTCAPSVSNLLNNSPMLVDPTSGRRNTNGSSHSEC